MTQHIYSAETIRQIENAVFASGWIEPYALMVRAGEAAFAAFQSLAQSNTATSIIVCTGTGNNGGDGYVFAHLAHTAGYRVRVLQVGDLNRQPENARQARNAALQAGVTIEPFSADKLADADWIIDALLGIGLTGDVRANHREVITAINAAPAQVLAIDIPSGLCADTGHILGEAIHADHTVTFIAPKPGLFLAKGPDYVGRWQVADLGLPEDCFQTADAVMSLLDASWLKTVLPKRSPLSHKGTNGEVLIIGGDLGYPGALLLAGKAALRTGAGLVRLATRSEHATAYVAAAPELIVHAIGSALDLSPLIERATTVVLGPGLGQSLWSGIVFKAALACEKPMVIDADGLNLLSQSQTKKINAILTPHPKEAARLLDSTIEKVMANRLGSVRELHARYGSVAILKGAGTLITDQQGTSVCPFGNPGMATAGMGDVLSGIIGALLAQGIALSDAAHAGVLIHALAGDAAAGKTPRGLIASDLFAPIRGGVN